MEHAAPSIKYLTLSRIAWHCRDRKEIVNWKFNCMVKMDRMGNFSIKNFVVVRILNNYCVLLYWENSVTISCPKCISINVYSLLRSSIPLQPPKCLIFVFFIPALTFTIYKQSWKKYNSDTFFRFPAWLFIIDHKFYKTIFSLQLTNLVQSLFNLLRFDISNNPFHYC